MKNRGLFVSGNWKMNNGPQKTEEFFGQLKSKWHDIQPNVKAAVQGGNLRICIFPPAVSLSGALHAAQGLPVEIGAQNAHWEKSGAFTGELSSPILKEIGINTVLVGHSERRQYFGETDETVRKRTESLLEQGMKVIMCIGESRAEREQNQTAAVLTRQLGAVFQDVNKGASRFTSNNNQLVIAYEPVWAIGTGLTATPQQAEETHQIIRKFLSERLGAEAANNMQVLYGGSVNADNAQALMSCPNIDGVLVGGASLKPDGFLGIIQAAGKVLSA